MKSNMTKNEKQLNVNTNASMPEWQIPLLTESTNEAVFLFVFLMLMQMQTTRLNTGYYMESVKW